ncbi:MAG: DUF3313 family protein [Lentisphaeria bacterium]|nr:DUF3313 family protein [Lentisphaeria bacterium]
MIRLTTKFLLFTSTLFTMTSCLSRSPKTMVPRDDLVENVSEMYASLTGFSSFKSTPNEPPPSIIGDLKKLKPAKTNRNLLYFIEPDFDLSQYNSVVVEPVKMLILDEQVEEIDKALVIQISQYFTAGLSKEFNKVLKENKGTKTLALRSAFLSLGVSFDGLLPHQFTPFGLALKTALRLTTLEERKLRVHFALRLFDTKSLKTELMVLDKNIKNSVGNYDNLTFEEDFKPLLDIWIERYSQRFEEINRGIYKLKGLN